MLAITGVLGAVYFFSSTEFTFSVSEPYSTAFSIQFPPTDCTTLPDSLYTDIDQDVFNLNEIGNGPMFPGMDYRLCMKIESTTDTEIPIVVTTEYSNGSIDTIQSTFPETIGMGTNYGQVDFTILDEAHLLSNYLVVNLGRGTE